MLSAYLKQVAFPLSALAQAEALTRYPTIGRSLLELFQVRFDPNITTDRQERQASILKRIDLALDKVQTMADERVLREFMSLILAIVRTNFYVKSAIDAQRISVKFDSGVLRMLPDPKPWREVFVYSPAVVVLCGLVTCNGGRWSALENPLDIGIDRSNCDQQSNDQYEHATSLGRFALCPILPASHHRLEQIVFFYTNSVSACSPAIGVSPVSPCSLIEGTLNVAGRAALVSSGRCGGSGWCGAFMPALSRIPAAAGCRRSARRRASDGGGLFRSDFLDEATNRFHSIF